MSHAMSAGPRIRLVRAPNPSPMTERGTNTYILGTGRVAVIDPGPSTPRHRAAILGALDAGERVAAILVTHAHLDHSALAAELSRCTGAPVLAYGEATAGRSAVMADLARAGGIAGGEGIDTAFRPDTCLADGETIGEDSWSVRAIHTPGHMGNHMSFASHDIVFTGDIVMGWASTLISPPDGDVAAFRASVARLADLGADRFLPGHGDPVDDPSGRCRWLIAHRAAREAAILDALADGPAGSRDLTRRIYTETPPALLPAAERNVLAHLVDLVGRGVVAAEPALAVDATFRLA